MASVSVIIVSYYTGPALWLAIDSTLSQAECREVIIVNNGNSAGDEKRLREWAEKEPRLKLVSGQGNVGFGKGNNIGVDQATGDYVLLLNPDSMLPENALTSLLSEIARFPENTIAGCYLMNPDGSEQRGGRRALLTPANAIAESLGLSFLLPSSDVLNFNKKAMPEKTHEVPVISGAFMFMAKSFYQRLGGFDEGYFLHMEDMDLCYRAHKAGGKIICIPSVKVIHFRSTSEVASSFIEKHKAKGFIRYLNKFFADQHSAFFLKVMEIGIYARMWIKICFNRVDRFFIPPLAAKREIARIVLIHQLTRFRSQDNSLAGKTILITDATSQLGLCCVGLALARGAKVIALYKDDEVAFSHPNLQWVELDLESDLESFTAQKADILIHTAELPLLPDALESLFNNGLQRVIAFSSYAIVDESYVKSAREKKQLEGIKEAEDLTLRISTEHGRNATILRPLMPYGTGFDSDITSIADIIRRFGFAAIFSTGNGHRNPVYAKDAAEAALRIIDNANTYEKIYNIGGGTTLTYREMLSQIFAYMGKPIKLIRIPFMPLILDVLGRSYQQPQLTSEVAWRMNRDISFDNAQAIEDFGYKPHAYLEGGSVV
jgi:GT2 family glycosyltransferase/nucleoside-diphosphate-sugar epimerase